MKKPTTIFWFLVTAFAVCVLGVLLPKSSFTSTIQLVVAVIGGALAVFSGGRQALHRDLDQSL